MVCCEMYFSQNVSFSHNATLAFYEGKVWMARDSISLDFINNYLQNLTKLLFNNYFTLAYLLFFEIFIYF